MSVNRKVIVLNSAEKGVGPFRIDKDRVTIGSVVSSDVRLTGKGIAPIHAVLEITSNVSGDQIATLFDLASESGVLVNGKKVLTQTLKNGDEISIGALKLTFTLEAMKETATPKERVFETGGRSLFLNPKEDFSPLLLADERDIEEIFDYRNSKQHALQVVMSWHGTVLDVEHFVNEKNVTVGDSAGSDFGLPPILKSKAYPIVSRSKDTFYINYEPHMKGVLQRSGKLVPLEDLATKKIPLGKDEFAKLALGEVDFYLSYSPPPPRLKRKRIFEKDPLFFQVFFASVALTGAMLFGLASIYVPKPIETEELPDRLATVIYQPVHPVPKPKPIAREVSKPSPVKAQTPPKPAPVPTQQVVKVDIKPNANATPRPIPKEMDMTKKSAQQAAKPSPAKSQGGQQQAKEGAGARAKGEEGQRGKKSAPASNEHQERAKRPSPQGGTGSGGGGKSQVSEEGNVDLLKSASGRIQDILGNTAARLGKGGEKIKGFGGFDTQGQGGLAISGKGKGGGGNAASLGGLADKGTGGGRIGTGQGAAGSGVGIVGGQSRVSIRSGGPEEAVVVGAIDAGAIEAALLANRDRFRYCYEKEINAENQKLAGRVGTSFVIGSSGRVTQAGVESTTLKNPNTEGCIIGVIKSIQFPIPRGAGMVQVTYPFKFTPVGGG
jgi:hypothetical protein